MIIEIKQYTIPCYDIPTNAFDVLNKQTQILEETNRPIENTTYYPFDPYVNGEHYVRVIDLYYVRICTTEMEDDLTDYGFTLIQVEPYYNKKTWYRM